MQSDTGSIKNPGLDLAFHLEKWVRIIRSSGGNNFPKMIQISNVSNLRLVALVAEFEDIADKAK